MEFLPLSIPGCFEIRPVVRTDDRGSFVKTFVAGEFERHRLESGFREQYYSRSTAGVVRGIHFQTPPHDHAKLVYCTEGAVLDAVVDLRRGSPSYGRHATLTLSAQSGVMVFIARGCGHGFCVTGGPATLVYNVTSEYAPDHDTGIRWDSAGIDWPVKKPLVSPRDAGFAALADFTTPFEYRP